MELVDQINTAFTTLQSVVTETPCSWNMNLSEHLGAKIYLKREDLQVVRSYKIRGAYNKIHSLNEIQKSQGIV